MLTQSTHIGCMDCLATAERRLLTLAKAIGLAGLRVESSELARVRMEVTHLQGFFTNPAWTASDLDYTVRVLGTAIDALAAIAKQLAPVRSWLEQPDEVAAIRELLRDARGPLLALQNERKAVPCLA